MNIMHPYAAIDHQMQVRILIATCVMTTVLMFCLITLDKALRTKTAPQGIISFELIHSPEQAATILAEWGPRGRVVAGISLGLDFLFLVVYGNCLALACSLIADQIRPRSNRLANVGAVLAWGMLLAALLDAIEDFALIEVLLGSATSPWIQMACWSAVIKFCLLALGGLFIAGALLLRGIRRLQ